MTTLSMIEPQVASNAAVVQLLYDTLHGRNVDLVEVINQLLEIVPPSGLRCSRLDNKWLIDINQVREEISAERRSLSMLRSMCARLAVLSHETTGSDMFLYGGEGDIILQQNGRTLRFHVKTMNTMGQQWFEIHPLSNTPAPSAN
jgi:hypothetical protein